MDQRTYERYKELLGNEAKAEGLNPADKTELARLRAQYPNIAYDFNSGSLLFDFNYEQAAKEAYGELGPYYDRLLKESKGDLNLAISRLTEDYDRGVRIRTEDTTLGNEQDAAGNQRNALARGIYNTSLFDPFNTGQRGIADIANPNNPFGMNITNRNRGLTRANEASTIERDRSLVDLPEKQRRYEANLEQERRKESAYLADSKANKALNKYQTSLTLA